MRRKIGRQVRQQGMGALALFLVVAGGTAYAANTIGSDDIIDGAVRTLDISNSNGVRSVDVRDDNLPGGGLLGADIANDSLTAADVQEATLQNCHGGAALYGRLCAGSDGTERTWAAGASFCASIGGGLRLPTLAEAVTLGLNHDVPGVSTNPFWAADMIDSNTAAVVLEDGTVFPIPQNITTSVEVVCVETPNGLP